MRLVLTHPRALRVLVACAVTTALFSAAVPAYAADTSTRTEAEIRAKWAQLRPDYAGSPYTTAPRSRPPYAAGTLAAGFVDDGLDAMNYARYLAGVPADVVVDSTYASRAQRGAVLLVAGGFSHLPARPAGMSTAFYNAGILGTSRGNIGWGQDSLWRFTFAGLDDSAAGNLGQVGHRRWILNPEMAKTGLGYASTRSDVVVFDQSRAGTYGYSSVKWPAEGLFPVQLLKPHTPWSITLNPALYDWASGGHTVTMRRLSDGRMWTFTDADTDRSGEFFSFNTGGYGVANCFIFRPDPTAVGQYLAGDVFDIQLSGGIYRQGTSTPVAIAYRTTLMSHNQPDAYEPDDLRPSASAILAEPPRRYSLDNPADKDWAAIDVGAGQAFDLTVAAASSRDNDVMAAVVDAAGTQLVVFEIPSGRLESRRFVAPVAGRYYVGVHAAHGFDAYAQPLYTLSLAPRSVLALSAPSTCAYAGPATLSGTLRLATGAGLGSRSVKLQYRRPGGGWVNLRTVTTRPDGTFATSVSPRKRTTYRVRYEGDAASAHSAGPAVTVTPRAKLSVVSAPATARVASKFAASAYLRPRHASGSRPLRFQCYRWEGGRWVLKRSVSGKATNSGGASKVTAPIALPSKGRWRIRAVHAADSLNAKTLSGSDTVVAK